MKKSNLFYELLTSVVFLVVGIVFFVTANQSNVSAPPGQLTPMAFPKAVSMLIIGISLYLIVKNVTKNRAVLEELKEVLAETDKRIWITCGLVIVYAVAWNYFSFLISTAVFFTAESKLIDRNRKMIQCLLFAVCTTVGIYLLFSLVFSIHFPEVFLNDVLGLHL